MSERVYCPMLAEYVEILHVYPDELGKAIYRCRRECGLEMLFRREELLIVHQTLQSSGSTEEQLP